MLLTVDKIIKETEESVSVLFKNKSFFNKVSYKPGQFLTLKLPIEGRVLNRAYSLSSNPYHHKFLRITVKKVKEGVVSNYICNELKEGQKIDIEKPTGNFYVVPEKKNAYKYVFFAAGSGITPIYSIIMSLISQEPKSTILLFYANRDRESIIFYNELEALKNKYPNRFKMEHILESTEIAQGSYHKGFLNQSLVNNIFDKNNIEGNTAKYFLCGPSGFMDTAKEILKGKNVLDKDINIEAFNANLNEIDTNKDISSLVKIICNGEEHELEINGNTTILQAAQQQKIEIPYSCRSGMCSTCKANCKSGQVKMMDGHLLSDEEIESGNILTCISFPKTENLEIVFD